MNLPLSIPDHYDTPADYPQLWLHKVLPHFQVAFKYRFLRINFHARGLAVRGQYPTEEWARSSLAVMRLLESCGGRFHVTGLANLHKRPGPFVFIGNHMSTLETMVMPFLVAPHMDVTFVVKDGLVKSRTFGPIMRSRDPIVVSRNNSREDLVNVMNRGPEILAAGRSIIIFPQSTRRIEFRPEQFNSLGVKLAAKAGVPVIPFAIKTDFWRNGRLLKDVGPLDRHNPDVHFAFGEPMDASGSGKVANQAVIEFIQARTDSWK